MRQKAAFTEIGSSPEQKAFSLIGSLQATERRIRVPGQARGHLNRSEETGLSRAV